MPGWCLQSWTTGQAGKYHFFRVLITCKQDAKGDGGAGKRIYKGTLFCSLIYDNIQNFSIQCLKEELIENAELQTLMFF